MATSRSTRAVSRSSSDFGDAEIEGEFGDRRRHHRRGRKHRSYYGLFGNAAKRRLKRPYLRKVVRKGRALVGKHKIGHVSKARNEFAWVTRGGSVHAAKVSKKGGHRKASRKGARKGARKHARKGTHRGRKK